jgi:hypothetical protein
MSADGGARGKGCRALSRCAGPGGPCTSAGAAYNPEPARLASRMPTLPPRLVPDPGPAAARWRPWAVWPPALLPRSSVCRSPVWVRRRSRWRWPRCVTKGAHPAWRSRPSCVPIWSAAASFRMLPAEATWTSAAASTWPPGAAAVPMRWWPARWRAWPTAASTCATSSGTRCATSSCWARARWCWPVTCAWPRTAWPTRSTRSSPASAVSTPRASPT